MATRHFASAVLALSVASAPVAAVAGDGFVGGVVGGIIGGIIVNEATKNRQQRQVQQRHVQPRATVSSAQREANREVQVALNYFGYPVGTPDGAIGPRSRGAISQYQATLGYPPTGQLTDYERMILVSTYQRAIIGGPMTTQAAASHPMGVRGLLLMQRDELAGVPSHGAVAPAPFAMAAQPAPAPAPAPAPVPAPVPVAEPVVPAAPGLPSFMGQGGAATASLASHCNKVSLLTNTNGGFVTLATLSDPNFALSEQFCLARTYAMAQAEDLMSRVPGFTPQQIAQQCEAFGPFLKEQVSALSLKGRDEVMQGVSALVLQSGMAPTQLAGTARICLGVGYTTDNMDVAIGSGLLLAVLGERAYAEMAGHHLVQGFGASPRPDLALSWYEMSLEAAGSSVFAPGMPDRAALIRKAAFTVGGRPDQAAVPGLPGFGAVLPVAAPVPVAASVPAAPSAPTASPALPGGDLVQADTPEITRTGVEALPLAARLPFLMFRQ